MAAATTARLLEIPEPAAVQQSGGQASSASVREKSGIEWPHSVRSTIPPSNTC